MSEPTYSITWQVTITEQAGSPTGFPPRNEVHGFGETSADALIDLRKNLIAKRDSFDVLLQKVGTSMKSVPVELPDLPAHFKQPEPRGES